MRFTSPLLLALALCAGCETRPAGPTAADWRAKLHTVTLADGVSEPGARIIADCYFSKYVACGSYTNILDAGDHWIVDVRYGYAGIPVRGFFIDKHSGKVTSPIGPSFDNPLEIYP